MAFLLAIEGADGAGKATATAAVTERLNAAGLSAAALSFPRYAETVGGWALGEYLAGRLPHAAAPETAATLYALDRFESRPHLIELAETHDIIVFDRYIASNMAYQAAQVPADQAPACCNGSSNWRRCSSACPPRICRSISTRRWTSRAT